MSESKPKYQDDMEKALELVGDPDLRETFARIMETVKQAETHKEAKEIKKKIINTPKKPEQQIFAFVPHEMAKVSIFFPMSDKELKEERRLIQKMEQESSWGKIIVEGVKLAIFEEDIFLAIIKIAHTKMKYINGQYVLETTMPEIAKFLYGKAGYTKRVYELIRRALNHFELIRFQLTLFKEQKKEERIISIGSIVQHYDYRPATQKLKIKLNPDFCALFLESMLTNINFTIRRKLKKDGSKAILRFLTAHSHPSRMHVLTVLKAINYNIDQPMYTLRRKLKQFITELKKNGILGAKTKLFKDDTVYFDILPPKKMLPE